MALTAGVLSQLSVQSNSDSLSSTAASGGTGPYTNQWYRSTTTGFTPGGGNIIAGATALTLMDSGLIPNTVYFYKVIYTDTGNANATVTSTQLSVTTAAPSLNPNQFALQSYLGTIDLRFDYDTISAQIDISQSGPLYAGSAVKIVDSTDGAPKVIGIAANTDEVFGYINFDIKTIQYVAGSLCEISQAGNVIYLYATGAIPRGHQVQLDFANNGVAASVGSSGSNIVGYAFDKATAQGQLIRVKLSCPSFLFA